LNTSEIFLVLWNNCPKNRKRKPVFDAVQKNQWEHYVKDYQSYRMGLQQLPHSYESLAHDPRDTAPSVLHFKLKNDSAHSGAEASVLSGYGMNHAAAASGASRKHAKNMCVSG